MPWEEKTVTASRKEFVERVLGHEKSKSALCREYGISRVTGDKWIERYLKGESMEDLSRAPHSHPNKIPIEIEEEIVRMRLKEPALGAKKIKRMMENNNIKAPAKSTINEVLRRNDLITREASLAAQHYQRFQREEPNELWQADFKGNFLMKNGERCHPLSIIDDCSRFCICADALPNEQLKCTKEAFTGAFRLYGLPKSILCDNGTPWGSSQSTSITNFEVWLMELGILTIHIRPQHPQCQGKVERFNGSYKRERLKYYVPEDLTDAQRCREEYREFYNDVRPHEAIGMDTPSEHYSVSTREYTDVVKTWDYESGGEMRRVKSSGYLTFRGQGYYLSEGLGDKDVMLYPSEDEDGVFLVVFREFVVAKLRIGDRTICSRKIFRNHDYLRKNL